MIPQDGRFDALLRERLGPLYLGWTGQKYQRELGGSWLSRHGARIQRHVGHHTAGPSSWTGRDVWRYHIRNLGWATAGYHVLVRPDGRVELLIPPSLMSYGAGPRWNPTSSHVVMSGNYHNSQAPDHRALDSYYIVFCTLDDVYGNLPWRGHREVKATACPGDSLFPHLVRMRGAQYGAATPRPLRYVR